MAHYPILRAELATERANLWLQLLAISRGTLTQVAISPRLTAKDVLDHIAAWDQLFASRVQTVLAGRRTDVTRIPDHDALNGWIYEERHQWPLERSVEAVHAARTECLSQANKLPWGDATGNQATVSDEWPVMLKLAAGRAQHDAIHAGQIRAWRDKSCLEPKPGPKCILSSALEAGRAALLAWGETIAPEAYASLPVCGKYTWRDLLGHLADWEAWYVRGLRNVIAGRAGGTDFGGDEEAWNRAHAVAREGQSWERCRADLDRTRAELMNLLDKLDEGRLAERCKSPHAGMDTLYSWFAGAAGHECDHVDALRGALGGNAEETTWHLR